MLRRRKRGICPSPSNRSPPIHILSAKGGLLLGETVKNIFQNEDGVPDRTAYTRIWLELLKRSGEQTCCEEVEAPDGDA